jgi:hypothetical protein
MLQISGGRVQHKMGKMKETKKLIASAINELEDYIGMQIHKKMHLDS